jgi:ABC-type multidrug transport system ATPase subunit
LVTIAIPAGNVSFVRSGPQRCAEAFVSIARILDTPAWAPQSESRSTVFNQPIPPTPYPMLRFENLSKRYSERVVFQALHYETASGCVALDDESGSGKSTLLGILAGTLEADTGEVWLGGHSLRTAAQAARSVLTYVPEDCMTYPEQTGRDYLQRVAVERNTTVGRDALALAERFGLQPHLDKRFEQMSFGTRKKIFLTGAVLGETKVVIADEPAGGLDASARGVLAELFKALAQTRTVFFCSYGPAFTQACAAQTIGFAELATRQG